jgi:hypothetical protein
LYKQSVPDVRNKENKLKGDPGMIEAGLPTKHASICYKDKNDGSYETIRS